MTDDQGSARRMEASRREAMTLLGGAAILPMVAEAGAAEAAPGGGNAFGLGRDQSFDLGWRFFRGDGQVLEAPAEDDKGWRYVDLPHDWSIEDVPGGPSARHIGPFDKDAVGGTATGYTDGGVGWYRKRFRLAALPRDARAEILFDGVSVLSEVWLNGTRLGNHVHGYTPFSFDLTDHLLRDGENVLAVRVTNIGRNSRWYAGSGIYRQVRIDIVPSATRIARWGVGAWTRRIADGKAEIDVTTTVEGSDPALVLVTRLRSAQGKVVAEASCPASAEAKQTLVVPSPDLWSPDTPYLYTLETEIRRGKAVLDRMAQPFGVRIVMMDAVNGLRINGVGTILRGGCIHHDNGILGAVGFADADLRRIRLLKARGFNAIRSSHNPASSSLRAACDRLGMLMINEAFDTWHIAKNKDDYSNYIREDWPNALRALVLGARNSPSVILWSIGNEIPYRSTPEGVEWCWKFANEVHRLDPTRPVTAALNGVLGAPVIASDKAARAGFGGREDEASTVFLDVAGYNYRLDDIESDHKRHPERIIVATETFARDAYDYHMLNARAPYFLGEFLWTAMDYIGEAGVGATARIPAKSGFYLASFPWINAWCGDIDLIGQQKPQSLARDVIWGLSALEMLVEPPLRDGEKEFIAPWGWYDELPIWTWHEMDGQPMAVRLYSSGDHVDLYLNGKPAGSKTLGAADKMRVEIVVPYAPGTLEAVAFRGGKEIARKTLQTVGAPAKLSLTPETASGRGDRQGLSYVDVAILDEQGRVVPDAEQKVRLSVVGPAELLGFGSANKLAVGSFQATEAWTFRGRALAILRGTGGKGTVRLEARADGLRGNAVTIRLA